MRCNLWKEREIKWAGVKWGNVPVISKTVHAFPCQTPGHLTFLKNSGQIPGYVGSLDGQIAGTASASKSIKSHTHQRLFKNFPTTKISKILESCLMAMEVSIMLFIFTHTPPPPPPPPKGREWAVLQWTGTTKNQKKQWKRERWR